MQPPSAGQQVPHRPGPLHQTNKTHKGGRNRSKSSIASEIKTKTVGTNSANFKREERLNQANQHRNQKREKALDEKRRVGSANQPPLLVGLIDLHLNTARSFLDGLKKYSDESILKATHLYDGSVYVASKRLKLGFQFITLNAAKLEETIEKVKSLDLIVMLHNPDTAELDEDPRTALTLRAIHMHCMPTTVHIMYSDREIALPIKRLLKSRISEEKLVSIDKEQDFTQLFHILGNCKRQKSLFKENRCLVEPDKVELIDGHIAFSGFVRRKALSPNGLLHVVGYDDYQIKQIDILPDPIWKSSPSSEESKSRVVQTLVPDPMRQETLELENEVDPMAGEQTWPTAEELAAEEQKLNTRKIIKKLPPGTSQYQAAWIPDEESDGDNYSDLDDDDDDDYENADAEMSDDDDDDEMDDGKSDQDVGMEDNDGGDDDINDANSARESVVKMDLEVNFCVDKESKLLEKFREAREDERHPDEIDTPSDVAARHRFARYRGLNSFRTSPWDPQENLPADYSRLYQFKNFQQTRRRILNEVPVDELHAKPGLYVRVHLAGVPDNVKASILRHLPPPSLFGLLKYERKMTVMNLLIKRLPDSNKNNPIKSKDELIFHVGYRKFTAKPIFSNHSMSSKFKYERFLRDDVAMVATIYAPVMFPPAPVLVFRCNYRGEKELVASGSVLDSNPNRMIIKRIRLSGHPFKIHSKSAVVRFMFFNSEDIYYFKPVELITRYNRRGHITEALGTHGHMKCTFDRKIRSDDCVFMNLYKRVYPKWTYAPVMDC